MADLSKQTVLFPELLSKPTHVQFDALNTTSDGGALLLKSVDDKLGLTASMARCLVDPREPAKVQHSLADIIRQRVFGLCCGYSDANDVARIGHDPMQKLLLDRDPDRGDDLASQPTLSRFENNCRRVDLFRLGNTLATTVIKRHRHRLNGQKCKKVTIDMDPTDDPVHGSQQLSMFNGHYGAHCYLPMLGFVSFNDEPDQYLVAAMLRPGNAPAQRGAIGLLKRLIPELRLAFPFAWIRVRLDGGFACPDLFEFLEEQQVEYLVAMGKNSVLSKRSASALAQAQALFEENGETVPVFGETLYAAQKWRYLRRVIYKAEVVSYPNRDPRDNCRFVVTNMEEDPEIVYQVYRQRGDCENRIKELKDGLYLDRLSCSSFWANQLRLLLVAAAYVLMQELRLRLKDTPLARAQIETLRLQLLKIGGQVKRSVRRIVIHLAANHPWRDRWYKAARALGAAIP
jgi:hypothetical protein